MNKISENITTAPTKPGIYLFYNKKRALIYVGKATNLKSRIRSYFAGQKSPRPIETFIDQVSNVKWIQTDSVLEAIILEANYIKKNQPKYNVLGKDDKSWNYLYLTDDEFPQLKSMRKHELHNSKFIIHNSNFFGPFPGLNTKETLKILRNIFHYSTCKPDAKRACFYYEIEQCLGVCTGEITPAEYRKKVIRPLKLFLSGKKKQVIANLKKEMKQYSKLNDFEEAARLRDQIANLKKIHDVSLLNNELFKNPFAVLRQAQHDKRIEGYDISNLGTTGNVGSMVIFEHGEPKKSDYRKFKIKTVKGQSDVDCLKEVLARRLKHDDWPMPDIILVDGGKPQVNAIKSQISNYNLSRDMRELRIPIVGIAKGKDRKKNQLFITDKSIAGWVKENKKLLIQVRDEAHRFAIKYQRQLRKIK